MRHRMEATASRGAAWTARRRPRELVDALIARDPRRGPATARDLDDGLPRQKVHWGWNWSETKRALEYLFISGQLADRRPQQPVRARLRPPGAGASRRRSSTQPVPTPRRDQGRAGPPGRARPTGWPRSAACATTTACSSNAARAPGTDAGSPSRSWSRTASCCPPPIEGWKRPAYLHRDAVLPRKVDARALLSPFDPVVWERERTEQIFDFHYRIEIYVPEPKRQFGYYVLPFLLGDRIVGRVDLKADRKAGVLLVKAAYAEPGAPPETAHELAAELRDLRGWLGLDDIVVGERGDLAAALGASVRLVVRREHPRASRTTAQWDHDAVLIRPADLERIRDGEVDLAFRRWERPRLRVGHQDAHRGRAGRGRPRWSRSTRSATRTRDAPALSPRQLLKLMERQGAGPDLAHRPAVRGRRPTSGAAHADRTSARTNA